MPGNNFSQSPVDTKPVKTKFRTINTPIPVPESIDILNKMYKYESNSMHGQMPIIWDKADDFQVYDCWGNKWIDFTSTIFVSNAGHGNKKIVEEVATTIGPKAFPSNPISAGLNPWIKLPGLSLNAIDSNPP